MMFLAEALANLNDCVDKFCSVNLSRNPAIKKQIEKIYSNEKLLTEDSPIGVQAKVAVRDIDRPSNREA